MKQLLSTWAPCLYNYLSLGPSQRNFWGSAGWQFILHFHGILFLCVYHTVFKSVLETSYTVGRIFVLSQERLQHNNPYSCFFFLKSHLPVPLSVLFLLVYNRIIWPKVLTLSLNMMPWACTMKKYVFAAGKQEGKNDFLICTRILWHLLRVATAQQ